MTQVLAAMWAGFLLLAAPGADLLPSPSPNNTLVPNSAVTPLPLPSIPSILPGPSPTPSSASSGTTGHGSGGQPGQAGSSSSNGGFGSSGIAGAFGPTDVNASTSNPAGLAPSPAPYTPVAPPASLFSPNFLFPQDRASAAQSAVLPLLSGLLLVALGLWLMAMRHRREALVAASLERTKTDFLNLASHELRGPLTVLKGYISTAREGEFGELPAELAGRLPVVQSQLNRMEMLVEQMLETARLEAGNPDVRREPADLRRIVRNALPTEVLEGTAHQVDVEVPDAPVVADVDERRIEQVLHNLVDNALKYSDPPAHVTVRLTSEEGTARIDVTDRGHGIAPEDMDKLFSRFGRLVTEENSHIPGVGLGLFLGRSVAQMHGGDVAATSTPGEGSTFTLTLPLHVEGQEPLPAPAGLGPRALRWFGRLLPSRARESVS
jgi:signal transduction histidine kinase